jgi:hypothetical protein
MIGRLASGCSSLMARALVPNAPKFVGLTLFAALLAEGLPW